MRGNPCSHQDFATEAFASVSFRALRQHSLVTARSPKGREDGRNKRRAIYVQLGFVDKESLCLSCSSPRVFEREPPHHTIPWMLVSEEPAEELPT